MDAWVEASGSRREQLDRRLETIRDDVALAEKKLDRARLDTDAVNAELPELVSFVAQQIQGASDVWQAAAIDLRIEIQDLLFPEGLLCEGDRFQTPIQAPIFGLLGSSETVNIGLASPRGFDTLRNLVFAIVFDFSGEVRLAS